MGTKPLVKQLADNRMKYLKFGIAQKENAQVDELELNQLWEGKMPYTKKSKGTQTEQLIKTQMEKFIAGNHGKVIDFLQQKKPEKINVKKSMEKFK